MSLFSLASTLVLTGVRRSYRTVMRGTRCSRGKVTGRRIYHNMLCFCNIYTEETLRRQLAEVDGMPGAKLVVMLHGNHDYAIFYIPTKNINEAWIEDWKRKFLKKSESTSFESQYYCVVIIGKLIYMGASLKADHEVVSMCKSLGMTAI